MSLVSKHDLSSELSESFSLEGRIPPKRTPENRKSHAGQLTRRECEVLRLLACGKSVPEISRMFNTSPNTVSTQSKAAYAKLCVPNAASAVASAMLQGFISIELPDITVANR